MSLSEWEGIVTVSGDGLLYEVEPHPNPALGGTKREARTQSVLSQLQVLNGLLDRPDWEDAVRMPIGVLPCGSGNALAGAVNRHGGYVDYC